MVTKLASTHRYAYLKDAVGRLYVSAQEADGTFIWYRFDTDALTPCGPEHDGEIIKLW